MARRLPLPSSLAALAALVSLAGGAVAQDDITIYRCTDASGHLTLQDAPCDKDQAQQTRRMLQPVDPPPRAAPPASATSPAAPAPESPRPVVVRGARPMYECVRPDGSRYTSDDADGDPHWVSGGWDGIDGPVLAGPGIVFSGGARRPATAQAGAAPTGSTSAPPSAGNGAPQLRFRDATPANPPPRPPPRPGHGHGHHGGFGWGYGGGYWAYDECSPLPQRETCARLRDRREAIRTRFFNAQANERATLDVEERGINARLAEDCGGS
ncbi:MAG TPA: DUF4124 domain-containing protein [Luteimonas sp.]|nr:DUF4124 domain-containing protein [Luteimonas sp.]